MRDGEKIHLINQHARPNVIIFCGENDSLPWKLAELSAAYATKKSIATRVTLLISNLPPKVLEPGIGGKTFPH